ncbi:TRAF-type zinc finger-containing protein [Corchorus olitorius]|uniref:TRAF-type zinc finger-containing protein n=1 Tax=Corchorus olitorius TaxID=93759 RepID=A0A1R3GZU6_9ROSI|nr:TRAF-type zinc finger-containing protein [Corchorus olitorius]
MKEKVKFWSAMSAEVGAVQVELMEEINNILCPHGHDQPFEYFEYSNLSLKFDQLKNVNIQAKELNSTINDKLYEMLAVLTAADDVEK